MTTSFATIRIRNETSGSFRRQVQRRTEHRCAGIPGVKLLLRALEAGAVLLETSADDLARETSLFAI